MDAILGKVLVSRFDGFINKKLKAGEEIAVGVDDLSEGFWVILA
jgi:hypothetical protein